MLRELFTRLWKDESGAVLATEYLMLGTVVAVGSASGLAAMRDGAAAEYAEFGNAVRETRQAYAVHGARGNGASVTGTSVADTGRPGVTSSTPQASPAAPDAIRFSAP